MRLPGVLVAAQAEVREQDVVTPFEEVLLVIMVFVIMFGLGAGLTPRDFRQALKRPWGLIIGWVTQFGIMPLLAFILVTLAFSIIILWLFVKVVMNFYLLENMYMKEHLLKN